MNKCIKSVCVLIEKTLTCKVETIRWRISRNPVKAKLLIKGILGPGPSPRPQTACKSWLRSRTFQKMLLGLNDAVYSTITVHSPAAAARR